MSVWKQNCHVHHCLANSRTFQDLASRFPGLSRTKVIFQDFPASGNIPMKIPRLSSIFQETWEPCNMQHHNETSALTSVAFDKLQFKNIILSALYDLHRKSKNVPVCFRTAYYLMKLIQFTHMNLQNIKTRAEFKDNSIKRTNNQWTKLSWSAEQLTISTEYPARFNASTAPAWVTPTVVMPFTDTIMSFNLRSHTNT